MPCHHMKHAQNVGPILFMHNENIAHIMPRVTAHAVTSCAHAGKPAALIIRGTPRITYGRAMHTSQTIFIENNCLTF